MGYIYWWGRDELGADDDADPNTGLKGKTFEIYNGLTGELTCKVDIGIDPEHAVYPMVFEKVAFEVERWADKEGKKVSDGYNVDGMHFFPYPHKTHAEEYQEICQSVTSPTDKTSLRCQ